jgi:glycosyltransferase involved in cell wall biosynthesis
MKIAFLHYHLKPGGVSTVIKQQIQSVQDDCDILVITGEKPQEDLGVKTVIIPEIAYDQPDIEHPTPEISAKKIIQAISDYWPSGCDLLHVHNPLLAKNRQFLKNLKYLAENNVRLFLQIHDFAEDGRPWVYYTDEPYPSDCHYGVINSRDYDILLKSGLSKDGLHLLQNMVTPFHVNPVKQISENFILYPVRAIRRKNIGEAILLSLFFPKNAVLAITLPPNSSHDWYYYNLWKQFAAEKNLNVIFEASESHDFTDLVRSARSIITTSISEGFGFSFLEPWTAGQMLSGRRLAGICNDFTSKQIALDHLYDKMLIPIAQIDYQLFYQQWKSCILENAAQLKIPVSDSAIGRAYEKMTSNKNIDFGILDEYFQKQVITGLLADKKLKNRIIELNSFLSDFTRMHDNSKIINHNRAIVETLFSQEVYRSMLLNTYQKIIRQAVSHQIDKQILAENFLHLDNFSLLKWSNFHV